MGKGMKTSKKLIQTVCLFVLSMLPIGALAQGNMILISGTDFSASAKSPDDYFGAMNEVDGFLGIIKPSSLTTDLGLVTTTKSTKTKSDFLSKSQYAVTPNPIRLDSLRMIDNPEWAFVVSNTSSQTPLLSMSVLGLKDGSTYRAEIEWCVPFTDDYLDKANKQVQPYTSTYDVGIRAVVNPDTKQNQLSGDGQSFSRNNDSEGDCKVLKISNTNTQCGKIDGGSLNLYISAEKGGSGQAIMIKSIKIYGEIDPTIYCAEGTEVCSGEQVTLALKREYIGVQYQWYKDGNKINGATSSSYVYETPSDKSSATFKVDVIAQGKTITSNTLKIENDKCCEVNGAAASRKVIFKDDFGEFDLSDATGHTYKVWDYSDITNPVQVTKKTDDAFRYKLDEAPLGCTYNLGTNTEGVGPIEDGGYTVAGVINGYGTVPGGYLGARLQWAGDLHGVENKTVAYDNSGKLEGCALFVNCKEKTKDQDIYRREITNLCENRQLFFDCSYSVFTQDAQGTYNPIDITVRLTEIGNPTNVVETSVTATSAKHGGSGHWEHVKDLKIYLEKSDGVILQIINNLSTDKNGNDLVLDDIVVKACAAPSIKAYYDLPTFDVDTVTCTGEDLKVFAKPTDLLTQYFGGEDNTFYQYQYTKTPKDKKSWVNYGALTQDLTIDISSCPVFSTVEDGDTIFFRVIAGGRHTMENTAESDFNPDDPCASYAISDAIPCYIDCPTCVYAKKPIISASYGKEAGKKVVNLCPSDATSFTTDDVTSKDKNGATYTDFTITWYKDGSPVQGSSVKGTEAKELPVDWSDASATGTEYIVRVHDNYEVATAKCDVSDTIVVYSHPKPETKDITLDPFCENDPSRATMLDAALSVIPSSYDITWYTDTVTPVKGTEPDVATAAASTTPYVSYFTITDKVTKCISKYYTFTFTVKEVPSEILAQIDPFCEYVNGAISSSADATVAPSLPASTKGYDVEWYKATPVSLANAAETDLSTLTGSTTPYTYYYTLSLDGCTSNPEEYEFTVRPLVKQLNLTKNNECDKTTLTVLTEPSDAVSTWNNGTEGKSVIFTTESEAVGTYSVTSKKDGYCESESESILSDFYKTPDALGDYTVQYLKSDGKATNGVFPTDKLLAGVAGKAATNATIKWIGQLDSSTPPSDTNGATDTPANPKADDVNDSKDETHYYFVYQQIAYSAAVSCPSKLSTVEVKILGAPAPDVTPVSYCLNDTPDAITNFATTTTGGATDTKTYSLVWFASEADYPANPLSAAPTISTANVGVVSYYVAQWDDADHNNISSLQHVDVTTYGVLAPTAPTPINYCLNDNVAQLSAVATTDVNPYWVSNGFLWEYDGTSSTSAPTPSTAAVGSKTYDVRSTYTTTTLNCVSDPFTVTVTVSETEAPSPQTIQYIKADAADGQTFPAITEAKKPWVEESGYTYFYSSVTENANVVVASGYTNAIPTPVYNTASLGGGSKELYYYVYRVDNSNPVSCPSDTVKITVKISDALSPEVKDVYVCEGSAVPDLEASVSILEGSGKTESEYSLLWYGTEDPSTSNNPTPKNTVSQTTFSTGITSAVAVNNAKTTTQYYVTQKDNTTGAESAPSVINVIVLPKPVIAPKSVPAQCEGSIDLDNWFDISNASEVGTTSATYKEGSNIVESTGIYAFTVAYPVTYTRPDYIVDDAQCVSDESSISVVIDKLDSVWIEGETTVCPGGDVELVAHISSSTHDENQTTYQWKDDRGGSAPWMSWTNNYPMTYASEADKIYNYTVTATAGTCVKTSEVHTVKVGDGPVRGTMTLTETDNTWEPSSFQNDTEREFYSCGGNLTISVDYEITDNTFSYQWYEVGSSTMLAQGPSLTIPETDASSIKTYEVRFVNKCDAKAQVTVRTIPLTVDPEVGKDTLCEGKSFSTNLTIKCDENPTIQWYLNTNPIPGANAKTYSKSSVLESEDDGQYSYEVTNRGCTRKGDAKYLDVQRYIKVVDFTEPFIVKKNTDQTIQLMIEVPETTLGVQLSDINWNEGGVSKQSGSSSKYTETGVVSDHTYEITLDDDDYCPTSTTATIWVEADLQLKTNLKDTICLGSSAILTIDTTGTGAFRKENQGIHPSLTVLRYTKGSKEYISQNLFKKNGDLIEIEVSPDDSASYTVEFTYDDQKVGPSVEEVTVIQAINLTLPPVSTICEGDTIKLGVSDISPAGTTVSWSPSETILSGADTDTIVAVPTYSAGLNHQGTYTYVVTAYNKTCDESKTYNVPVKVDEALVGTLKGSDVICEGAQGKIDASSYDATTYEWKANDEFVSSSATALVRPTETTTYEVEMTRGVCKASDSYELKVTSLPVITSVDSIGIRDRQITMEPGKGTGVFYYWIDVESSKATDNVVYNLTFSKHVAFVRDENGCQTSFPFEVIAPPVIIPEFFTPNGDGVNDNWLVEVLKDVYPDSKVQIFDRFGKLMAEYLGGDSEGWDGTYKGTPMPSTDYWYVIDIEEIDRQFSGHFTLIRQ